MALIVMPSLLSKRPWARIRARCEASFFIVFSKSVRCCSVRGSTYLTLIDLESGCTYHIVWELQREILYQKTFGLALIYFPWAMKLADLAQQFLLAPQTSFQLCYQAGGEPQVMERL